MHNRRIRFAAHRSFVSPVSSAHALAARRLGPPKSDVAPASRTRNVKKLRPEELSEPEPERITDATEPITESSTAIAKVIPMHAAPESALLEMSTVSELPRAWQEILPRPVIEIGVLAVPDQTHHATMPALQEIDPWDEEAPSSVRRLASLRALRAEPTFFTDDFIQSVTSQILSSRMRNKRERLVSTHAIFVFCAHQVPRRDRRGAITAYIARRLKRFVERDWRYKEQGGQDLPRVRLIQEAHLIYDEIIYGLVEMAYRGLSEGTTLHDDLPKGHRACLFRDIHTKQVHAVIFRQKRNGELFVTSLQTQAAYRKRKERRNKRQYRHEAPIRRNHRS